MTPKEIAEELIYKMENAASRHDCFGSEYLVAKDCALIVVDEIVAGNITALVITFILFRILIEINL